VKREEEEYMLVTDLVEAIVKLRERVAVLESLERLDARRLRELEHEWRRWGVSMGVIPDVPSTSDVHVDGER
jgi:hypothetical protein